MKKIVRLIFGVILFSFFTQIGGIAHAQSSGHSRKSARKILPQRPKEELTLAEVTIYGQAASLRMPKSKVTIKSEPPRAALLGWGLYEILPPTELQSPELPQLPLTGAAQAVHLDIDGGNFKTGDARFLYWREKNRFQWGVSGTWRNSLGTASNRFYHQGTTNLFGGLRLSRRIRLQLRFDYLQNSFGFGNEWPADIRQIMPVRRKLHAAAYSARFVSNRSSALHWSFSYGTRLFPTDNAIDRPYLSAFAGTQITHKEKTQILSGTLSFQSGITTELFARAIFNRDRFPFYPAGIVHPGQLTVPEGAFQNSQTFVNGYIKVHKNLKKGLSASAGLNYYAFTYTGKSGGAFVRGTPRLSMVYNAIPNWQLSADYESGYTFRTRYDVYRENPFYDQSLNLNQLEYQKVHAKLAAEWAISQRFFLKFGLAENSIQNYPVWESILSRQQILLPANQAPVYSPGAFRFVTLPEAHFNQLNAGFLFGQLERSFFKLTAYFNFNKSLKSDPVLYPLWNYSKDVPFLPDLKITFEGRVRLAPRWRLELDGRYMGSQLIEKSSFIVPLNGSVGSGSTFYGPGQYLPDYLLLNAKLRFLLPFGSVYLGTWNALNQIIEPFEYIQDDGRKFFGGMEVKF